MKLYDVIRKEQIQEPETLRSEPKPPIKPNFKVGNRKKRMLLVVLMALGVTLVYVAGIYLVRATVIVSERHIPFTLEGLVLQLPLGSPDDSERLSFQTMKISGEINREIFGSELTQVTGKAKGSVVFLNEYTKSSVSLKSGTRLVGQNGKSYTTAQSVTVPGYTTDSKNKKVAGASISVAVVATESGSASNSSGMSLSISGYTGSKKTQLYARSVGEFTGGDSGMRHTVSDAERPALVESLKTQLGERLRRETRAQIPAGFITYPDLQIISINSDSLKLEGEGIKFTATIKGSMTTYLIPQSLFEVAIAKEVLSDPIYTKVTIPGLSAMTVTPQSALPANTEAPTSISLKISGQESIIAKVSTDTLKLNLLGQRRSKFDSIINTFPEIDSARFRLTPFWAPFFPKQTKFFTIQTK